MAKIALYAGETQRKHAGRGRPATPGLRERILDAASEVFGEQPFHQVHVADVARKAKVAKGTVYRYFPTKEALYLASLFHGMEQLQAELETVSRTQPDPRQRLEALATQLLEFFWGRDLFFLLLHRSEEQQGGLHARAWRARRQKFAQLIAATLEEGIAAAMFRRVHVPTATEALLGMLRGVHRYRRPDDTPQRAAQAVLDLFLHGVAATAPDSYANTRGKP
ncbi:MAG: TetR family transcriptional regulator [Candidatus Binatia bacterium]|nr:MAG: TetR family transcriptional regulator [Candidatus Binatia bacterium]